MERGVYSEVLLTIGEWTLLRRNDGVARPRSRYRAMIGHECSSVTPGPSIRNGERNPNCSACNSQIPDEIWGLWQLMCNDQSKGWDDGEIR